MTKEYFDSKMQECLNDNWTDEMYNLVYEFFESNVCIPKGEQRHPYADVFHEWAEDTTKEIQLLGNDALWYSPITALNLQARIKPSEPVYEYLYYDRIGNTVWSTKEDAPINMWCAEETKRVRQ